MWSLNQLQNGFLTRTADQGMNDEMMIIVAHTDATTEAYIIKDIEHMEFRTTNGQQLSLRTDNFYLGSEDYHIAGASERIVKSVHETWRHQSISASIPAPGF
jgi:hypothetical protein